MLLSGANLSKSYGERLLFSDGSFKVEAGDKIGLIGANGVGKTTLFKIISGELLPDTGGVVRASGITVGLLSQHACAGSTKTAFDEALTVFAKTEELERELEELTDRLHGCDDLALIEKTETVRQEFLRLDGLTYRAKTRSALLGLGFSEEELSLPVSMLSGGQKSKIELCRLLLSSPDVMLLDEPTNHLDIDAIEWLDSFIAQSKSAAVIISHDRYFLDRVATKILSIEHGKIYFADGNYTKYQEQRALRELTLQREYDNTMKEVHRIEGIIEQQRRWNREKNIKTAESKQKQIDRMLENLVTPDSEDASMSLRFTTQRRPGAEVLSVKNMSCRFDSRTLYEDVCFSLLRGERAVMLGRNGCGKTTLLRSILKSGGFGIGVSVGYFDQHGASLDPAKTIFGQLRDSFPALSETDIRSSLALFLFRGDEVFREISTLSGGERARVALCSLMLRRDNLLLLDEPTNHLDLESREILENALADYDGTILAVSHDRYFINRIAKKIFYFKGSSLLELEGNYDNYIAEKSSVGEEIKREKPAGTGKETYIKKKEARAEAAKQRRRLSSLEAEIEQLEAEIANIEKQLCDPEIAADYEQTSLLCAELTENRNRLSVSLDEWETVAEELQ